jgi:phosphoglycerate dehydrogenase-like enzyme
MTVVQRSADSHNDTLKLLIALYHPFELWTAPPWFAPRLSQEFPRVSVVQLPGPKYEGLERELANADIAVAFSIRPEQFAAANCLRWIHSPAAAVHQLLYPELIASDVILTNARNVHGSVVAEHAVSVMLALAKRIPSAIRYQQQHRWAQTQLWEEQPKPSEIVDATVCVIGMGSIGREFARRAVALGMKVIAVREHPELGGEGVERVVGISELDTVLPLADYIVLAAPLTPRTRDLINEQRLKLLKGSCYLVNVSRGPLIDDTALIRALRDHNIGGAALDVFVEEPLPADSPYWDLENVLITPHTAAITEKLWHRHYDLLASNLRRFIAGEPLLSVVDKQKGY